MDERPHFCGKLLCAPEFLSVLLIKFLYVHKNRDDHGALSSLHFPYSSVGCEILVTVKQARKMSMKV